MIDEVAESELEKLKARDDVRAVAFVGSYARNPEKSHNDLDVYVIVDGGWRKRETEEVDGVVVERFFNSMDWSKKYFESDNWFTNYYWFKNADVRYDPDGLFEELADYADQQKEEKLDLSDQEKDEILYTVWDMQQDLDTDDVGQKRYLMYQMLDYLVEKHYLLKGETPVKTNYRVKKLKDFDGYMYKLVQDFLTSSSTGEKHRTLEKIVDHVTRGLGKPGPEWETDREDYS